MNLLETISSDLSPIFWLTTGLIILLFVIQVLFYLLVYKKPFSYERKRKRERDSYFSVELPSVSVVVVSKNESDNLARNLPSILNQNYHNFEVIVVNMGSTDETDMLLESLSLKYSNLYHTFVPSEAESINEKKLALTLGIKAASNEVLLFTEAYCKPISDKWIEEFAHEFVKGREVVLGYSGLEIERKFFMRGFVQYDNLIQHVKFLSMAIWKKPFMGINRNLAYLKSVFFEEKGFSSVLAFEDGEDDLFINNIRKNRNVGVVVSTDSMTKSDIVKNFATWKALNSKYLYSKKKYKGSSSLFFGFESFTMYLLYLTIVISIAYGIMFANYSIIFIASLFFIVRFIISLSVINKLSRVFDSDKTHLNLILFELFQRINSIRLRKSIKKRKGKR